MNEIWIPDKLRERLVVGARVRFRANPECPYQCPHCGLDGHEFGREGYGTIIWIQDNARGMECRYSVNGTKVIGGCGGNVPMIGHDYAIEIEGQGRAFWAAAIELEPLHSEDES